MDEQRFDELTRALAGGTSRRRVLKGLTAGLAAVAAGITGFGDAEAARRCRTVAQICRKRDDCCAQDCGPADSTGRRRCGLCPDGGELCGGECCSGEQFCLDGGCCDNPCGEGSGAICCTADDVCVVNVENEAEPFACCPSGSYCQISEACCDAGTSCTADGCCAESAICEAPSGDLYCCPEGLGCTDEGCIGSCPDSTPCVDDGGCGNGQICCDGCCVDGNTIENCGACGVECPFYLNDPRYPGCCFQGVCFDYFACSS
jgi:hypothetical protein